MFAEVLFWIKNPFTYSRRKEEKIRENELKERMEKRLEELRKRDPFIYE